MERGIPDVFMAGYDALWIPPTGKAAGLVDIAHEQNHQYAPAMKRESRINAGDQESLPIPATDFCPWRRQNLRQKWSCDSTH
jgi:hypothetical protein